MWHMGDVLAGNQATWEFASDSVLIRFERGIRTPKLFQALRQRRIPHEALESVTLTGGRRGTVILRAVPRAGADPLMEAASGQLKEGCDPYRLVLPAAREPQASYYAEELATRLVPEAKEPAERFLVAAPEAPRHFKAYDGKASFDGAQVSFRWSRTGASSAKWKCGDQNFPVSELTGVDWRSPDAVDGYLRLRRHGEDGVEQADQDPSAVVFGLGYGPVHESLPFAAAVLGAARHSRPAPVPAAAGRCGPAEIAERIRHLSELHHSGLVTDDEFNAKKADLLAEL